MKLLGQLSLKIDSENPGLMPFVKMLQKGLERVKRDDTEIEIRPLKKGLSNAEHLSQPGLGLLNDREILKSILNAENDGYDGVVVMCGFDPALKAARQMLDIPVVGIFESAVHLATTMGSHFAVITSEPSYIQKTTENIIQYGMNDHVISQSPVRSIPLSSRAQFSCVAEDRYTPIIEAFEKVADECINHGAEVLIIGCGMLSVILTHCELKEFKGVPVIDPLLAGIKFGEMMVDLQKAGLPFISRQALYFKPRDPEMKDILTNCFD